MARRRSSARIWIATTTWRPWAWSAASTRAAAGPPPPALARRDGACLAVLLAARRLRRPASGRPFPDSARPGLRQRRPGAGAAGLRQGDYATAERLTPTCCPCSPATPPRRDSSAAAQARQDGRMPPAQSALSPCQGPGNGKLTCEDALARARGFTLIEIMVVVLVIGILLAIACRASSAPARPAGPRRASPTCTRSTAPSSSASWTTSCPQRLGHVQRGRRHADDARPERASTSSRRRGGSPNYIRAVPACPSGGTYAPGGVSVSPTCSIATDPNAAADYLPGGRGITGTRRPFKSRHFCR